MYIYIYIYIYIHICHSQPKSVDKFRKCHLPEIMIVADYPLVNAYITTESHHVRRANQLSMGT